MSNPVVLDPVSRLLVEQPLANQDAPSPSVVVVTDPVLGVVPPVLANYARSLKVFEAVQAGNFVTLSLSGSMVMVRKASASSTDSPACGYVMKDAVPGENAVVYFDGPNALVPTSLSGLVPSDVGSQVWLSPSNPGAVQKSAPIGGAQLKQTLGMVLQYSTVMFVPVIR